MTNAKVVIIPTLIWWTEQEDCEAIGNHLPESFPNYLQVEYRSRLGRAGRGRLWVASQFAGEPIAVDPWPNTPMGRRLATAAGIAICAEHAELLREMPGVITDLELHRTSQRKVTV